MPKYLTSQGYCKWCTFKHSHHPSFDHCQKMIDRALARERKDDQCHHCGHSKAEHVGKILSDNGVRTGPMIMKLNSVCDHIKRGVRKDGNFDWDDYCHCEVFL